MEHGHAFFHLLIRNHQRHHGADYVSVLAAGKNVQSFLESNLHHGRGFFGRLGFGPAILDEFEREHWTESPDVVDNFVPPHEFDKVLAHLPAELFALLEKVLFFKDIQHGIGGCATSRVAAIRTADSARVNHVHDFLPADHRRQRHTAGQAFGGQEQIRFNAPMLDGEQVPTAWSRNIK